MSKKRFRGISMREKRMCLGKAKYATRSIAQYALDHTSIKGMDVYQCEFCGKFHLGHTHPKHQ